MDALSTPSKGKASNSSSGSGSSGKKRKREEGTPKSNGASTAAAATPTKASSSSSTTPTGRLPKQPRKDKKQADSKKKEAVSADDVGDVSVSSSVGSSKQQANGKQRKVRSRTFSDAAVPAATAVAATTSSTAAASAPQSAYRVVYPVLNMPIAPVWWKHPLGAVRELFDTMVMRYVPQLNGILIAHEEHTFLTGTAEIRSDSAFATVPVKVKCTIWAPSIGMRLEGKIVYSNTDVVSLLLNGTFNAAIPAAHLPPNQYEFVHNDYSGTADSQVVDGAEDEDFGAHSPGFWRRKRDKTQLGGSSGQLTFTCFGITVANQLLFLRGSLLDDPLSASQAGGDRSSTDPSSTSPSVDARALQTLFPNVNLDFSSKDGLESGARRSAVRGANANGSGEMGGAAAGLGEGGEGARRRVRWYDQEEGEDGDDDDDDDDEDGEGPQITFGGAAGSTSASASASTPAIAKSAEKVGNDDDDDYEMIDLTTTTTSAPTISKAADADAEVDVKPKHKHKSKPSKSSSAVGAPAPAPAGEEGREETDAERKERKRERKRLKQEKNAEKARRRAEREARRAEKEAKRSEKAAKHAAVKKEAAGI
ncbi:hypothetical protein A4X09_0g4536 [Tilletia walkeri]|uniref:RPA43 OB domain-containing protein n=1 Tax=Tilletia walkeri TaxID=117179 RepID=A0A8X7T3V7_9BASI|nr:hypothetical protein A4X09_0g4536 [Tilletia walkeri]